jgi:thioredoxin-related protein
MIKHILLFSILFSLGFASIDSFAKKNNYYTNYQQAKAKAIQTHKPLMLLVVTTTCPWCEKLKKQTLSKKEINNYISKNYIPLILNRDKAQYPTDKFEAKVVPTVFFVDPKNETIIENSYGYKSQKKFLNVLEKVNSNYKGKS